jgi:hypothetical protein
MTKENMSKKDAGLALGSIVEADTVGLEPITDQNALSGRRVRIQLEENDNIPPTGQFIGVNGRGFMLRPGEAASVPVELLDVLDAAVESKPVLDPLTRKVIGWRNRLRFPYRTLERDPRQTA